MITIIAIAKNENKYINEWVNWHLNIGFDNIILCENNDSNGERLSQVINNEKVKIVDYIDVVNVQPKAYTEQFIRWQNERGRQHSDWAAFIDVDEFICIDEKLGNIHNFVEQDKFKDTQSIKLNWMVMDDNGLLDVEDDNYNVMDRLTHHRPHREDRFYKSIIRGDVNIETQIRGHGYYDGGDGYISRNAIGQLVDNGHFNLKIVVEPTYEDAYIKHFITKTIGEYVRQKYFRGGPNNNARRYNNLNHFFKYNDFKQEKKDYAETLLKKLKVC